MSSVPFTHRVTDRRPYNLRQLLRPHRPAVALALLLVVAETLLLQAGPLLTQIGIDHGVVARNVPVLVLTAVAYVVSLILSGIATGARVAFAGRLSQWINYDQRVTIFTHLQRLSLDFFSNEKAGRIMSRMTGDIEATDQLVQNGIIQLGVQALTLVVVTAVLFSMNARLALITVVVIVPSLGLLTNWFRVASRRGYLRVRDGIAAVLSDLQETLGGMSVITAGNRQARNVRTHLEVLNEYREANVHTAHLGGAYGAGSALVGVAGQATVLFIGGNMVLSHQLTIGQLAAFVLYLTAFFAPIQQMAQLYNTFQQGQAAIGKLAALMATRPSVVEAASAKELPPLLGTIELHRVTFGYNPDAPVLKDLSLRINAGETLALVGPTGAGKSTVAKLVSRLYDPHAGAILVDGYDLREVTLQSLRGQLGVVPQEPYLFAGTVRDNIAFGRPASTDEEVMEAAVHAGLGDLIERLPAGIHTEVHERGASLSAGERQLLALARAFLAQPSVIVLDEATSNLDPASERRVEAALDTLLEGRTAIIIAHRLSTAKHADRIALVDGGVVAELGTHSELVELGGRYAAMYRVWASQLGDDAGTPSRAA